jgi:DNA polymerase theta
MESATIAESRSTAISKIKQESATYSNILCAGIAYGFAYHHSGLSTREKDIVEKSFRQGILSVLCATTTLATGVNLPAGRVIIESMEIGGETLDVSHYRQMSGRAGRAGQSTYGESYLLVKKPDKLNEALELVNGKLPDVKSQLHPKVDGGRGIYSQLRTTTYNINFYNSSHESDS